MSYRFKIISHAARLGALLMALVPSTGAAWTPTQTTTNNYETIGWYQDNAGSYFASSQVGGLTSQNVLSGGAASAMCGAAACTQSAGTATGGAQQFTVQYAPVAGSTFFSVDGTQVPSALTATRYIALPLTVSAGNPDGVRLQMLRFNEVVRNTNDNRFSAAGMAQFRLFDSTANTETALTGNVSISGSATYPTMTNTPTLDPTHNYQLRVYFWASANAGNASFDFNIDNIVVYAQARQVVMWQKTWVNGGNGDSVTETVSGATAGSYAPVAGTAGSTGLVNETDSDTNKFDYSTDTTGTKSFSFTETMGGSNIGSYTRVLSCSNTDGISTTTLTLGGTDPGTRTYTITPSTATSSTNGVTGTVYYSASRRIVCTYTNTRTSQRLRLAKTWGANSNTGDTASATTTAPSAGGSASPTNNASMTATAPTDVTTASTAVVAYSGEKFVLPAETGTNIGNYTQSVACAGLSTLAAVNPATGTEAQRTLTISGTAGTAVSPAADTTCTYTNTRKSANLKVAKAWGSGSSAVSATVSTSGFSTTSVSVTSAAPTGATSTASQIVYAGEVGQLTETVPTNYKATYACSGSTTVDATGKITVAAADAGTPPPATPITCTITNTPNNIDLAITKTNTLGVNGEVDQTNDTVTSGLPTTYTIVVKNNGTDPVANAVVTDSATAPALTGCAVVAAPTVLLGTVTLPATFTYAGLSGGGITIPFMSAGGSFSFQVKCDVK